MIADSDMAFITEELCFRIVKVLWYVLRYVVAEVMLPV